MAATPPGTPPSPAPLPPEVADALGIWARLGELMGNIDWVRLLETWGLRLFTAALILVLGLWVVRLLANAMERALGRANVDPMLRKFLHNIARFAGSIVIGVAALTQLGVPPASLIAVLGAAGLAVGLALKDSLSNFASGVMLILLRPFRAGDFVQIAGLEGVIEQVNVFQTRMRTVDNRIIVLPNSQITTAPIINFTARPVRRLDIPVGVAYGSELGKAREALLAVAAASPRVAKEPPADVVFTAFADSSINLLLRAWVPTPDVIIARSELIEAIHAEFNRRGISIPFPQRDVHLYPHPQAGSDAPA